MTPFDWATDAGCDWLHQDRYGSTISKVDAAEAWMPAPFIEAEAERAAAERDVHRTQGDVADSGAALTEGEVFDRAVALFEPGEDPHQAYAEHDAPVEAPVALADADIDALHNDLLLLEAVQKWSPMDTLDIIGPNIEDAARLLALVRATVAALRRMDDELTAFIADVTPPGSPYAVEGVGALTIRPGAARKGWDHDGIIPVCAAAIAEEMGVTPGPVGDVIRAWLEFTGPPSRYRTTALKPVLSAADHSLDEFVTTTYGAKSVEIS